MATAKKTTKAVSTKSAPQAASKSIKPIKAALNKTELLAQVAEHSGVELKAVKAVLASLEATIGASLNKKGAGEFVLPGLLKVVVQNVPAKKARKGIDPFTKEERMFAAKPASVKLRFRALKKLKDAAQS